MEIYKQIPIYLPAIKVRFEKIFRRDPDGIEEWFDFEMTAESAAEFQRIVCEAVASQIVGAKVKDIKVGETICHFPHTCQFKIDNS
jgi:hypothetical protein